MKDKLLSDHKRIGKVFQPPILAKGTIVETAWLDFAVPEFAWINVLCQECGTNEGSILFLEFAKITDQFIVEKVNGGIAATITSSYSFLSEIEKIEINRMLKAKGLLPRLKHVLRPFLLLYPMCPLKFVLEDDVNGVLETEYLPKYKEHLRLLIDKTSFQSTLVMANVFNFMNHFERLKITEDSHLPQLDEVLDYPRTENSKKIAAFMRSSISVCFNKEIGYNRGNDWIKFFWNQGLRLEKLTV